MRKTHWITAASTVALGAAFGLATCLTGPASYADGHESGEAPAAEAAKATTDVEIGTDVGKRVAKFDVKTLTIAEDGKHDSSALAKVTVYVMNSETCPFIGLYEERLRGLEKAFGDKGVEFVHIYANKTETDDGKMTSHGERKFVGPMVLDTGGVVGKLLAGKRTPELVACGKDGVIFYRGGIDDDARGRKITKTFASDALTQFLAGKKVETPVSDAKG